MRKAAHLSNKFIYMVLAGAMILSALPSGAGFGLDIKKRETSLSRDVYDQNIHYELTTYLHLDRFYRDLFKKKVRAQNVNVFDEVPDSSFYVNRHGRMRMSPEDLARGYRETEGPDLSGDLTVIRGKFEGLSPGFFVRDVRGDEYLLKFDPIDYFEMVTGAEVIGSRFYHAFGYYTPQYTLLNVDPQKMVPSPDATIVDDTGFGKKLTAERLQEYLLLLPTDAKGFYRASASKVVRGDIKGYMSFQGRRKGDPEDTVDHQHRRELRALQVFSSWVNNFDMRASNTLDVVVSENDREFVKHYLIDFNCALGANAGGPKPPMRTHEYTFDYGQTIKSVFSLGWWEKPWQKRWKEQGEDVPLDSAVGYFDNRYFDPGKFKTQLPHYVFKNLTRADGFWAAKIIMKFSDEDIRAVVKTGELSRSEDAEKISQTLIERRDIIGRYWFEKANPLDDFDWQGETLSFKDLSVTYGFVPADQSIYQADVIIRSGKRKEKVTPLESKVSSFKIDPQWFNRAEKVDVVLRTIRPGQSQPGAFVLVELTSQGIAGIYHQD